MAEALLVLLAALPAALGESLARLALLLAAAALALMLVQDGACTGRATAHAHPAAAAGLRFAIRRGDRVGAVRPDAAGVLPVEAGPAAKFRRVAGARAPAPGGADGIVRTAVAAHALIDSARAALGIAIVVPVLTPGAVAAPALALVGVALAAATVVGGGVGEDAWCAT